MDKEHKKMIKLAHDSKDQLNEWETGFINKLFKLANHHMPVKLSQKQIDKLKQVDKKLTDKFNEGKDGGGFEPEEG